MAVNVATIGFAADTSGLEKATDGLRKLVPAAAAAESAADGAADALGAVGAAAAGVAPAAAAAAKASRDAATGTGAHAVAAVAAGKASNALAGANDNAAKAAAGMSYQAKNLSFQLVDVTQGVLSGISPMQIFAQQAGQIGQAIASAAPGQNLFKEIGKSIASILTPMRLLTLGLLALPVLFYAAVSSVAASSKALDDLSKAIDTSTAKLRGLQTAGQIKGLSTEEFQAGIKQFGDSVYDAQRNMGSLNGLMIANGKSAKDLAGYFDRVADLVMNTASGAQRIKILQEAGLPTTARWVDYMAQGSVKIREAANATQQFNDAAEKNMIKKMEEFDELMRKVTTTISGSFKSAVVDAFNFVDKLSQGMLVAITAVGALIAVFLAPFSLILAGLSAVVAAAAAGKAALMGSEPAPSGRPRVVINGDTPAAGTSGPPAKTQAELLAANSQAQQRIGLLGDLATVEDRVKQKELELAAAGLQGIGVSDKQRIAILNVVRAQEENNRVQQQSQLGIFNLSAAQKAAADTLQMYIDKGLIDKTNTEQMAAAKLTLARNIKATSDAAAIAAAPLQQLKQLELDSGNFSKVLDSSAVSTLNSLGTVIGDVTSRTTSLSDGFKNAGQIIIKAIQEMIIKMLIITPIAKALQAALGGFTGGAGGIGGGILSLFGIGTSKSALGNVFANDNIQPFARGGAFTNSIVTKPTLFQYANGGAFGQMGEAGPEAVMPLQRGPNGSLGVQMYGQQQSSASNSATPLNIDMSTTIQKDASPELIDAANKRDAENRKRLPGLIADTMREMQKRNMR